MSLSRCCNDATSGYIAQLTLKVQPIPDPRYGKVQLGRSDSSTLRYHAGHHKSSFSNLAQAPLKSELQGISRQRLREHRNPGLMEYVSRAVFVPY